MRAPVVAVITMLLLAPRALAQGHDQISAIMAAETAPATESYGLRLGAPLIADVVFVGLRRIAAQTLLDKMVSRPGFPFTADGVAHDLHTLGKLGWFDDLVRVEATRAPDVSYGPQESRGRVVLTVFLEERPFLTTVEYTGSELLSRTQIDKLLSEKKLAVKIGEPENCAALHVIAYEIAAALHEMGHPEAHVAVQEQISPQATVRVRFAIYGGPHVPLARVNFTGDPGVTEKQLRGQMHQLRPGALFAGWRGKNVYTRDAFEQDREGLLSYYRNHGYPEARVGKARVSEFQSSHRRLIRWLKKCATDRLAMTVPVEAGPFYKIGGVQVGESLSSAVAAHGRHAPENAAVQAGTAYSYQAVEDLRQAWESQLRGKVTKNQVPEPHTVEVIRSPDTATHTMGVNLRLSDSPPYIVRRLQFVGMRRFPDRYFRKRILLKEGAPLDERVLEAGLTRLARTGYFKPIKKEDVHVETNDVTNTADITIRIEELGQQRISLVGGREQFGSTLGIVYMLYNVLDREELLSSRVEAGPETLQIALGLAKEGFLGSRGTLALSVFNMFLRPRLTGPVRGPFFEQRTEGVTGDYNYALSNTETLRLDYAISRSHTNYSLGLPIGLAGLPASDVSANTSSHSLGLGFDRNTGSEHLDFAESASGGLLGGSENLVRSKAEYGRIFRDPIFNSHNAWAFHTSFSAVGSYSGDMPLYARGFVGEQFVRGLSDGELGPDAVVASTSASGATTYSGVRAGANLITAFNAEYRMPIVAHAEAATFFDLGAGRLLPNWLGSNRPSLLDATNGFLHGSTGVELSWTVPGVGVPVRLYYAVNVLRLNRWFTLADGSLFRAHNRFSAFGWGLGSMF